MSKIASSLLAIVMVLTLGVATPALSEENTTEILWKSCANDAPEAKGFCLGFVTGVAQTFQLFRQYERARSDTVCIPEYVEPEKIVNAAMIGLLKDRRVIKNASLLIAAVLEENWPCE